MYIDGGGHNYGYVYIDDVGYIDGGVYIDVETVVCVYIYMVVVGCGGALKRCSTIVYWRLYSPE